jgi:hypothetical protein
MAHDRVIQPNTRIAHFIAAQVNNLNLSEVPRGLPGRKGVVSEVPQGPSLLLSFQAGPETPATTLANYLTLYKSSLPSTLKILGILKACPLGARHRLRALAN